MHADGHSWKTAKIHNILIYKAKVFDLVVAVYGYLAIYWNLNLSRFVGLSFKQIYNYIVAK